MLLSKRYHKDHKSHIRLNAIQLRAKKAIENKINRRYYRFEEIPCPICGSNDHETIGEKDRFGLYHPTVICIGCGLVFVSPRMTSDAYLEFYQAEYGKLYTGENQPTSDFFWAQYRRGKLFYDFLKKTGLDARNITSVLEVGCSAGGILKYFQERGHNIIGIDLDETYLNYGRSNYNLNLHKGTLGQLHEFIKAKPDLIIYSHVLEHIHDLNQELSMIKQFCTEKTLLLISVPGIKNLLNDCKMDFLIYLQNAHLYHFSLRTLNNLLSKHDFVLINGNEDVNSVFKLSPINDKAPVNDYTDVLHYLKTAEQHRWLYRISPQNILKEISELGAAAIKKLLPDSLLEYLRRLVYARK